MCKISTLHLFYKLYFIKTNSLNKAIVILLHFQMAIIICLFRELLAATSKTEIYTFALSVYKQEYFQLHTTCNNYHEYKIYVTCIHGNKRAQ